MRCFTQRHKGRHKAAKENFKATEGLLCAFVSSFVPLRETC
jgi:hypothetical protein